MRQLLLLIIVGIGGILLFGCTTTEIRRERMAERLRSMVGQNESAAIQVLGSPHERSTRNELAKYTWQVGKKTPIGMETVVTNHPVPSRSTKVIWSMSADFCEISLLVAPDGIIRLWEFAGDEGCDGYYDKLDTFANSIDK